mgnify:CR=1 FL=1
MRMGIFVKRPIVAGEELTFNYNVDRYGNDAQTCHCNEPNCVGTIGGKTQTDVAGMDDLFIDGERAALHRSIVRSGLMFLPLQLLVSRTRSSLPKRGGPRRRRASSSVSISL